VWVIVVNVSECCLTGIARIDVFVEEDMADCAGSLGAF